VGTVSITPETFTMVLFEPDRIRELASEVAAKVGVSADIEVDIDEASALGRARVISAHPVKLWIQGGALEDPKRPRHLADHNVIEVFGRLLFRVRDRLDDKFGDPPSDEELTLPQSTAWDAYGMGRLERLGYRVAKPRRLYHFRNRHGFTDVADAAFERLWNADGLTWADIEAVCAETEAARAAV
jgi:hypothetical protein